MRKIYLALVLTLLWCGLGNASVGIKVNGVPFGDATNLNLVCSSGTNTVVTSQGSDFNVNCSPNLVSAGLANGGATSMTTLDLAVPIGYTYVRKAIASQASGSFSAGTLANGYPGQILTLFITQVGASGTFVVTPTTKTGFTSVTFNTAKQEAIFLYVDDTTGWVLLQYTGSTLPTVTLP